MLTRTKSYKYLGVLVTAPHLMARYPQRNLQATVRSIKKRCLECLRTLQVISSMYKGASVRVLRLMYFALVRSVIDYASPVLSLLPPSSLKPLELLQNKAMRIILGCPMSTKILVMRKELDIPSIHSRIMQINTLLGVKLTQLSLKPNISQSLLTEIGSNVRANRPRQAKPSYTRVGWVAQTAELILRFHVWNTDPLNIPRISLTAPWHRTHVHVHIDRTPIPKAQYTTLDLREYYVKYIDRVLNPPDGNLPLAIYCDASVHPSGAAGICVLVPDMEYEESIRISDWASTTDAEAIAIYHALQKGSERQCSLAVFSDSQGALHRLTAFNTDNLITCNTLQLIARLSNQGIRVSLHWIPSHIGIFSCNKTDKLAKSALHLENPHYGIPLSLAQLKQRIINSFKDYEDQTWIIEKMKGSGTIQHYEDVVGITDKDKRFRIYNGLTRRQQVTLTKLRIGYQYIASSYVEDAALDKKPNSYHCCRICKLPKSHSLKHYLLECPRTASYRSNSVVHRPSLTEYIKCIIETGLVYDIIKDVEGFLPPK